MSESQATAEQTIRQNQQELMRQQAQIAHQQATIEKLELAFQSAPAQQASRDPKLPDVPSFNGDTKKTFEFLAQLNIFFNLQPGRFSSDLHKSYYLGMRCTGPAQLWFTNAVAQPNAVANLSTFSAFLDSFKIIFSDPTRLQDAERSLLTIKQGPRSVAEMLPEFQTLVLITGWAERNLFRIFLEALNTEVRDELLRETRPESFVVFVNRAITIDRQLADRRTDRSFRPNQNHRLPPPPVDHSRPMDLSATQTRRGPLTPEERQHRFSNGLCLVCGKSGHIKSSCPLRRQDFQPRQ